VPQTKHQVTDGDRQTASIPPQAAYVVWQCPASSAAARAIRSAKDGRAEAKSLVSVADCVRRRSAVPGGAGELAVRPGELPRVPGEAAGVARQTPGDRRKTAERRGGMCGGGGRRVLRDAHRPHRSGERYELVAVKPAAGAGYR
jgi:hypothetical protein